MKPHKHLQLSNYFTKTVFSTGVLITYILVVNLEYDFRKNIFMAKRLAILYASVPSKLGLFVDMRFFFRKILRLHDFATCFCSIVKVIKKLSGLQMKIVCLSMNYSSAY